MLHLLLLSFPLGSKSLQGNQHLSPPTAKIRFTKTHTFFEEMRCQKQQASPKHP